jgi:hypothetical protein
VIGKLIITCSYFLDRVHHSVRAVYLLQPDVRAIPWS